MSEGGPKSTLEIDASCLLLVADRIVLRTSGPPDAEYAMFDVGDIELRAIAPGRVGEHGYQTTAEAARARLANLGATPAAAREVAALLQPELAEAYARGPAAKRLAPILRPIELLESSAYDASARAYRGVFIDLALLSQDLALDHVGTTFQALELALLLENEREEATVMLSTDGAMRNAKPGARSFRRPTLVDLHRLHNAISGLVRQNPRPQIAETLPHADVVAFVRARGADAVDEAERDRWRVLLASFSTKSAPERGPLAVPEVWEIEQRLDRGEASSAIAAIDDLERRSGRTPGSTYLRARAALALGLESPKLIAGRISALALSMSSFRELGLLAAEAWLAAGDPRRAMPYARDLVDSPGVEDALLLRARKVLLGATQGLASPRQTLADSAPPGPQPIRGFDDDAQGIHAAATRRTQRYSSNAPRPAPGRSIPASAPPTSTSGRPLAPPTAPEIPAAPLASRTPTARPPAAQARAAIAPPAEATASFTLELPRPQTARPPGGAWSSPAEPSRGSTPAGPPRSSTAAGPRHSHRPRMSGALIETRPSAATDPRAEPDGPMIPALVAPQPIVPQPLMAPPLSSEPMPQPQQRSRPPREPSAPPPEPSAMQMRGASLPPYREENPAPLIARAPLLPKLPDAPDELAEHLPLPPGLAADQHTLDVLPRSVLEARVQFTLLARELGLDYRLRRGIELRADVSGLGTMQAVLLESYPQRVIRTRDDEYDLRRHGALLSEILARRLDAEWLDITPSELGYWVMIVPPNTRIWPFGRIARLIAMGSTESDLVSYFFELEARRR